MVCACARAGAAYDGGRHDIGGSGIIVAEDERFVDALIVIRVHQPGTGTAGIDELTKVELRTVLESKDSGNVTPQRRTLVDLQSCQRHLARRNEWMDQQNGSADRIW